MSGVISGDMSVEHAVMVTESATLPPARKVITFEATPPGQEPTSTTPAAISGGKPKAVASPQPTKGITPNWSTMPTKTGQGILRTRVKSPRLRVVPIPNMMSWMRGTMRTLVWKLPQLLKSSGQIIASTTATTTDRVKPKPCRLGRRHFTIEPPWTSSSTTGRPADHSSPGDGPVATRL